MFCSSDEHTGFVAVLTQERLLRLLQNEPSLKFDILVIDEAHELMNSFSDVDSRSVILGAAIIICHKRNMDLICKYLTPFLKSGDNLRLKYIAGEIKYHTVMEYINIFDVLAVEEEINGSLSTVSQARDLAAVFNIMNVLFFSRIKHDENNNLMCLKEEKAQIFYRMLIEWHIKGFSMKEMPI